MPSIDTGRLWETKLAEVLHIHVNYYDEAHRRTLLGFPSAPGIEALVAASIALPVDEFLTYFLFHKARTGSSRFAGYTQIRRQIALAWGYFQHLLSLENGVLSLEADVHRLPRELTEHVGESVALALMNRIHGLVEADWLPIDEGPGGPTFDFQFSSNGSHIVQVEAKARVVANNEVKSTSISQSRKDIGEKKAGLGAPPKDTLRYGVITGISQNGQPLRSWLLDPPPDNLRKSPADLQVLARLHFLRWIIWLVSPRSPLATALATRISAFREMSDASVLSNVELIQADGRPFELSRTYIGAESFSSFFGTRSRVEGGAAGGIVVPVQAADALLFLGMRERLLSLAIGQDFADITDYREQPAIVKKTVECIVPRGEFRRMEYLKDELPLFEEAGSYVRFQLVGSLAYTADGIVFGVLPVPGRAPRSWRG